MRPETSETQGLAAKIEALSAKGVWREVDRSTVFRTYLLAEPAVTAQIFVFKVA